MTRTYELWQKVEYNYQTDKGPTFMVWCVEDGCVLDWYDFESEARETFLSLVDEIEVEENDEVV
jgi:hypothetical protein